MAKVETYVFIDLETTGMPTEECNRTKITELSMVAVKRTHLLDKPGSVPRVQHKITLCLNPCRMIGPIGIKVTRLNNLLLENEPVLNQEVFNMINSFLNVLSKPVCLIAQNGLAHDFPILKKRLEKLNVSFADDLLCADCYHGFYDILKNERIGETDTKQGELIASGNNMMSESNNANEPSTSKSFDEEEFNKPNVEMQKVNETTPKKRKNEENMQAVNETTPQKIKKEENTKRSPNDRMFRRTPWPENRNPEESYKLKDIYKRVLKKTAVDAHQAENDCIFALEISAKLAKQFVKWVDENYVKFSEIKPMTIGVPMGF